MQDAIITLSEQELSLTTGGQFIPLGGVYAPSIEDLLLYL